MKSILTLKKQDNVPKYYLLLTYGLTYVLFYIGALIYEGGPYLLKILIGFSILSFYLLYLAALNNEITDATIEYSEIEIFQDSIIINQQNLFNIRDIHFEAIKRPAYSLNSLVPDYYFGIIKNTEGSILLKIYFSVGSYVIFDASVFKVKELIDKLKFHIDTDDKAHEMIAKLKENSNNQSAEERG